MRTKIEQFIKSFRTCQQTKAHNHKPHGLVRSIEPLEYKWVVMTMDFVVKLLKTARVNYGTQNVVCKLSKMIRITPIKSNITATEIAAKFELQAYRNHGLPSKIISDSHSLLLSTV